MTGPSFRFRLERVRAVRERKEDVAKLELAEALARLSRSQRQLRDAQAEEEHARVAHRLADGTLTATELIARQAFLERVEAERLARSQELKRCEAEVAARDAALASASSDHEMLKKLRERHRGAHNLELARRERVSLDEIAANRFHRSPV